MSETTLAYLAEKAASGNDLDESEIRIAANQLTADDASVEDRESFLVALADKGESAQEIAAFASCFREFAVDPMVEDLAHSAIDVCGTGGDKSGSFNVSTTVAFVLAAAGGTLDCSCLSRLNQQSNLSGTSDSSNISSPGPLVTSFVRYVPRA